MPAAARVVVARIAFRLVALGLVVGFAAWCLQPASAQERARQPRLALVIGEGAYPQGRLPTAVEDAGLMASAFAQTGFEVTALADADAATLRRTIADFVAKARAAGPAAALAVYVSGDGMQYDGENWLMPVGARIERDDDVPRAGLKLAEITAPLQALPASMRLFLFDLARETPFAKAGLIAGGLAIADAPVGSVYAFDAAPGAVAPSSVPPYGAYARALAEAMRTPGLPLDAMLRRVRLRVGERTDGAVVPFDDGSADPGVGIVPGAPVAVTPPPELPGLAVEAAYAATVARDTLPGYAAFVAAFPHEPLTGRVRAMAAVRREALFWSEAVRANTPRAYWTYLRRYPRGPHYGDVRRMLFTLHAALEPPPRFDIVGFEGLPPPASEELALLDRPAVTFADADGPSIPPSPAALLPPASAAFYEALPPPPVAPSGALPMPLLLALQPSAAGPAPEPGTVREAAAPGGALVTSLAGTALATARGGKLVSRVSESVKDRQRTIVEVDGAGHAVSKTIVATGADGGLSVTQTGPGDRILWRAVSRDASGGLRETSLAGPDGRIVATTTVTADGIVKASALVPGQALPPRFVLAPAPDAKGEPMVVPEVLAPPPPERPALPVAAGPEATAPVAKPPPPPTPGLTGEVPKLDLPPAPKGAAFDSGAAPVASEAPAAAGSVAGVAPPSTASPPAAPAAAAPSESANLPIEPPLPPRRAVPQAAGKPRHRGGR